MFFLSTFCPLITWFCKAHCTCTWKNSPNVGNLTFRYRVVSVSVIRIKTPMPFIFLGLSVQFKKEWRLICHVTLWVWRFSMRDTSVHVKPCLDTNAKNKRFSLPPCTTNLFTMWTFWRGRNILKGFPYRTSQCPCHWLVGNYRAIPSTPPVHGCAMAKAAKNAVIAGISLLTLYLRSHVFTVHLMAGEGI